MSIRAEDGVFRYRRKIQGGKFFESTFKPRKKNRFFSREETPGLPAFHAISRASAAGNRPSVPLCQVDAQVLTAVQKGDGGMLDGNEGGTKNAIRSLWSDKSPEVSINNDIPSEIRIHPNQWGSWLVE